MIPSNAATKALNEAIDLLKASRQPDTVTQQRVYKQFERLRTDIDFNQCLAYIFASSEGVDQITRRQAGIILRGNLSNSPVYATMPEKIRLQIKETVSKSLGDEHGPIRTTVGSILATIASLDKCEGWGNWLVILKKHLNHTNPLLQKGALTAIESLLEDCADVIMEKYPKELHFVLQGVLETIRKPDQELRQKGINALGQVVKPGVPIQFKDIMDNYLKSLHILANEEKNPKVLVRVGWGYIAFLEAGSPSMKANFGSCVHSVMKLAHSSDEKVVYSSCEFFHGLLAYENLPRSDWLASSAGSIQRGALRIFLEPHLKTLVTMFLSNMTYSEEEEANLGEEKNSDVADDPRDIVPRHATIKDCKFSFKDKVDSLAKDEVFEWSVRKSSARNLDDLAYLMGEKLLPAFFPLVKALLAHSNWKRRESGILSLGAVAHGCSEGMLHHAKDIFTMLLKLTNDEKAPIRRISCWTLSRCSQCMIEFDRTSCNEFLPVLVKALVQKMGDVNKQVQKAACSAIVELYNMEIVPQVLVGYIDPLLSRILECFKKYQESNLHTLFDLVGTLARVYGQPFGQHKYLKALVPDMIHYWSKLDMGNYGLFPLLECLSAIARVSGKNFAPYAKVMFPQCLKLIAKNLSALKSFRSQLEAKHSNGQRDENILSNSEFQRFEGANAIICCIELAGAMSLCMGDMLPQVVDEKILMQVLLETMTDSNHHIRQCSTAWLGELVSVNPGPVVGKFENVAAAILNNLDPKYPCVCSNAAWATGQASIRLGARRMSSLAGPLMIKLVPLLGNGHLNLTLRHNIAITISRLGLICPVEVAKHLEHFGKAWCQHLVGINDEREAALAYRGLVQVINKKPHVMLNKEAFEALCDSIASYNRPPENLFRMMKTLLHGFRSMSRDRWGEVLGWLDSDLRQHLFMMYELG